MAPADCSGKSLKIKVEVLPWLSGLLGAGGDEEVNFELMIYPDSTLHQFLDELAIWRPEVADLVYDQDYRVVKATALLMLNDRAFELAGGYGTLLNEGDRVTLLAAYNGG